MGALADSAPAALWRADSLALSDGANVTTWTDSSGNGFGLSSSGTAPKFVASATPTGKPAVRWVSGSGYFESLADASASNQTILVIVSPSGSSTRTMLGSSGPFSGGNGALQYRLETDGKQRLVKQATADVGLSSGSVSSGTFSLIMATFTAGSSYAFRKNGAADGGSTTAVTLTGGQHVAVGRAPGAGGAGEPMVGDIALIAKWSRILTSTEIEAIEAELTAEWLTGSTTGAVAASLPSLTVAASGTVADQGQVAATLPSLSASVAGDAGTTAAGDIAATLPSLSASVAGIVTVGGSVAAALPPLSASVVGDVTSDTAAGSVAATLPRLSVTADGVVTTADMAAARVFTPSGVMVLIPLVPATPPASLDLVPITLRSHVMEPLSAAHPEHEPHGFCEFGDNTITGGVELIPHLWIGGRDVTFLRDRLIDIGRWESEVPFGDTAAAFAFPQMDPWDAPGSGDLDFLYPDAPVHIGLVDDEGAVRRVWSGFYDANGLGMAEDEDYPWEAKGTLWMAMHQVHEPRPFTEPIDIWVLIARALNGVINRRWARIPEEPIGIVTLNRGARDQMVWEYVQELLSEAVTDDGRQWTITEVTPGVFRPALKAAPSEVHATVAVGTPGVDVDLRIDESTRVDGFYARAIGPDNGGWAHVFYPGLELLIPPPYPNNDASVIQLGDTDADTDSGDGVTAIERRLNELGRWGRVAEDGVWESSDAAILYDAQGDLGILQDGQPGPQTWNRLFNRSGEGIDLNPRRLPLVVKDWVLPRLYDAAGVDIGPNPDHDPDLVPRLVPLDLGFGKTKRQATRLLKGLLNVYGTAGAAGTIQWELDANELDRTRITHLTNVKVRGHQGVDRVLQVSHKAVELDAGSDDSPRQYVVTTRVDEHARDAMAVEDILEQRRSALPDLSRRPGPANRASRQVNDQRIPWDSESPCGYVRRTAINGAAGLPSVIPVPFAEVGKLAGIELTATQPFAFMVCASLRITENKAQAIIGDPFSSSNPFRPHYDALEPYGIIEAWGEQGDACGFSPLTESEGGAFTGRFILNTSVDYWTETVPYVSVVVWMRGASGFIQGRFIPAYEG